LSTKLVNQLLPEYVAPNVLTLIGFFFAVLPFAVLFGAFGLEFTNDAEKPIPNWFFFMYAYCYLMYRIFDQMDEK
jgi:phosphatidylglycerophosphate synthase